MEFFFNFKFELTEKKMHSFYLILSFLKTFFVYLKKFKDVCQQMHINQNLKMVIEERKMIIHYSINLQKINLRRAFYLRKKSKSIEILLNNIHDYINILVKEI